MRKAFVKKIEGEGGSACKKKIEREGRKAIAKIEGRVENTSCKKIKGRGKAFAKNREGGNGLAKNKRCQLGRAFCQFCKKIHPFTRSVTNGCTVLYGYSFLLHVIGCYVEKPMGLTNLKFSSNHMRVPEGAADRRFLIFYFQTWEEIAPPALKKPKIAILVCKGVVGHW